MLTEIHRQAAESGILRLATAIREGRSIDSSFSGSDCEIVHRGSLTRVELAERVLWGEQVIVGRNATRRSFNQRQRELLGMTSIEPEAGDKIVCLRNDRNFSLFNGSQWIVEDAQNDMESLTSVLKISSTDLNPRKLQVDAWLHHMLGKEDELTDLGWTRRDLMEFDYSYAMTCHKAQGSQWDTVVVYDESASFGRSVSRQWLYTAVTRAAKELKVIL